jgi:CBS domain-containing protein
MKIREIMTPNVSVVAPNATLKQVAQQMRDLDVGALPVCDGTNLIGMLTDRDVTIRATAEGLDPNSTTVDKVLGSGEVVYCFEDQDTEEAATLMGDKQIRRLPILSRDKKLVGIVSLGDLAVQTGKKKMVGNALEDVSQPAGGQQ